MTEFLKNSEPFCMNIRKFRSHVHEFCRPEDSMSELRLNTDPYVGNFR